ncbi:unnamed protein product [Euphydryas editha]|uniref:Uncharacterized protein n=1 Tax=Euphydryas editha TaxID=104508 RepID=A0AAU9TFF9_EUPED|nr:unnamed protein product [Euphydryas editha]
MSIRIYVYLSKQVSFHKNNNIEEISRRINISCQKYWAHREIMKEDLPLSLKKKVMDSGILPCLTYGWSAQADIESEAAAALETRQFRAHQTPQTANPSFRLRRKFPCLTVANDEDDKGATLTGDVASRL